MTPGYERAIGLTGRVKVGAYYTDGKCLAEIYKVARLGHIMVRECETGGILGYGIDAFRAHWWLVFSDNRRLNANPHVGGSIPPSHNRKPRTRGVSHFVCCRMGAHGATGASTRC